LIRKVKENTEVFQIPPMRLTDNPSNACICHSEPCGKLRINSAKNLMDSGTYTSEILRLTPQNDVIGQNLKSFVLFVPFVVKSYPHGLEEKMQIL